MSADGKIKRSVSIRRYLLTLVLLALTPVALAFGIALAINAFSQRAQIEAQVSGMARRLAEIVDRELDALLAVGEALANSLALERGDFETFHAQARTVLASRGSALSLARPDGRQLVNTYAPWGTVLPDTADPILTEADRAAIRNRRPVFTDLHVEPLTKKLVTQIVLPVMRNDEVEYLLDVVVEPSRIAAQLAESLPPAWTGAVIDGSYRIIARSRLHDRYVGSEATADVRRHVIGQDGLWQATTLEGAAAFGAYATSRTWAVKAVVGAPASELRRPLTNSLVMIGTGALGTLLLSFLLAGWMARRLVEPIRALARTSSTLGNSAALSAPVSSGIIEIEETESALRHTVQSLATTNDRLAARQRELLYLTERFRAAEEALGGYVYEWDIQTGRFWRSENVSGLLGLSAAEFTPTVEAWLARIHPDDIERLGGARFLAKIEPGAIHDAEYRIRHKAGHYVWVWDRARFLNDARGAPRLIGTMVDISERRAAAELRESLLARLQLSEERLALAVSTAGLGAFDQDHETGAIYASPELRAILGFAPDRPYTLESFSAAIHEADRDAVQEAIARAQTPGSDGVYQGEHRIVRPNGEIRWISTRARTFFEGGGSKRRAMRTIGAVRDITQRRTWQDTQRLLMSELNHRVRNTLAVVQAIANQTLVQARHPREFVENFKGRLQSIAGAHRLLTDATWRGADLKELIGDQLGWSCEEDSQIECVGPDVWLSPETAINLGLVLHELGTNARKYGSLSVQTGRLRISWSVEHKLPKPMLRLKWVETGGPPVSQPLRRGFGTTLVERTLGDSEHGRAEMRFEPEGLICEIETPLGDGSAEIG